MVPIFIACLLWLPALVGLGIPLARTLQSPEYPVRCSAALAISITGLLGMFVASTFAAFANFFVAIHPFVSTALGVLGWISLPFHHRNFTRLPYRAWYVPLSILLIIALIDARGIMWYDTGLYHLQAVQWLTHGPLPRGLSNLYECLGYNCSWFPLAAAIETPLLLGKSCFVLNAIFTTLIALPAIDAALRTKRLQPHKLMLFAMLIPLAQFTVDVPMLSSLSPDLTVMMLIILSITLWITSPNFIPHILVFALFAVTIKLSAIPFLILACAAAVATRRSKLPLFPACFCIGAAVIFLIRGIWLSGYAAYPAAISRIPNLSWTTPPQIALHAAKEIQFWSRYNKVFEQVEPNTPWITAWGKRVATTKPMWIAYILFIVGIIKLIHRRPKPTPANRRAAVAFIALLPALAFWFQTAPQVRFGYGYIFPLAVIPLAIALDKFAPPNYRKNIVFGFIFSLLLFMRLDRRLFKISLLNWPQIPVAQLDTHHLPDGTRISTPRADDRVWNAPLPATTDIQEGLHCITDSHANIREWQIHPDG